MRYEIWLGTSYMLFDRGFAYMEDGRTLSLSAWQHTATYGPDSVLIGDEEGFRQGNFPLRWFIRPGGLSFYSVGVDTPDVRLHNESGRAIQLKHYGLLEDGDSMDIIFGKE